MRQPSLPVQCIVTVTARAGLLHTAFFLTSFSDKLDRLCVGHTITVNGGQPMQSNLISAESFKHYYYYFN